MTKNIHCTHCKRCIKIEGPTEGLREVEQRAICPYCETPNEIKWPMGAGYTVGRCDGDEFPKPTTDGCGEEFFIGHNPASVDRWVAEKQAKWLENVLAEEH